MTSAAPSEPVPLDIRLNDVAERERIEQITRLYLVVQGRPPDRGGLEAYAAAMRAGESLRDFAAEFLSSAEFLAGAGSDDPAWLVACRALGPGEPPPPHDSLPDLVCALVRSPVVAERLSTQRALYPDGVRLDDATDYRAWLATSPLPRVSVPLMPISFIVPIHDLQAPWPDATIRSVLAEADPGIELLIVARHFDPRARVLAIEDRRVRLIRHALFPTLAQLFNRALASATGLFTALLLPGDRLDGGVLPAIAAAAEQADIILSDEDRLDAAGRREAPRLGAAWDPDRMLATGRPGLLLARTALLKKAGGFRANQPRPDWDLLLRASTHTVPTRIVHVPVILVSRGSAAPQAGPLDEPAAREHLRATGQRGAIVTAGHGRLRVVYPLPKTAPRASIVIATRDRAELLDRCTQGLLNRTDYPAMELVLVDNGSTDPDAVALLSRLGRDVRVRIVASPGPFNWAALNNLGVSEMQGEVAVLLNNDTDVIASGWLRELVSQALRPGVGVVGAKLLYPDGTIQHAGMVLGRTGNAMHMWRHSPGDAPGYLDSLVITREVSALTGACLALKRDVYQAVGGCNADILPITWNDVDLCLKIRETGLRAIWTPHACLMHLEQATRGRDDDPVNQARYKREQAWMRERWGDAFVTDPFLNPHLLPSERDPLLATHD